MAVTAERLAKSECGCAEHMERKLDTIYYNVNNNCSVNNNDNDNNNNNNNDDNSISDHSNSKNNNDNNDNSSNNHSNNKNIAHSDHDRIKNITINHNDINNKNFDNNMGHLPDNSKDKTDDDQKYQAEYYQFTKDQIALLQPFDEHSQYSRFGVTHNVFAANMKTTMRNVGSNLAGAMIQAGNTLSTTGLKVMRGAGSSLSTRAHCIAVRGSNFVRKLSKQTTDGYDVMDDDDGVSPHTKVYCQHILKKNNTETRTECDQSIYNNHEDHEVVDHQDECDNSDDDDVIYEDEHAYHLDEDDTTTTTTRSQRLGYRRKLMRKNKQNTLRSKMKLPTISNDTIVEMEACIHKVRTGLNRLKSAKLLKSSDEDVGIVSGQSKTLITRTKDRANMMVMHLISAVRNRRPVV